MADAEQALRSGSSAERNTRWRQGGRDSRRSAYINWPRLDAARSDSVAVRMARTHKKVRFLLKGKRQHTEASAAKGVEEVLQILEGRW